MHRHGDSPYCKAKHIDTIQAIPPSHVKLSGLHPGRVGGMSIFFAILPSIVPLFASGSGTRITSDGTLRVAVGQLASSGLLRLVVCRQCPRTKDEAVSTILIVLLLLDYVDGRNSVFD